MSLAAIKKNTFLVLGRAGMDLYADPPGTRVEEATRFTSALGGSAANIAAGLTRLGAKAALLGTVSDDAVGRYVLKELARYKIDTAHVRAVGGEARNSLAVVETRAENCQSVIYRNGAADFQLTGEMVAGVDFSAYGALILTGTSLAMDPSRAATLAAIEAARGAGLAVILDVDYRPYSWTSREEAAAVCLSAAERCHIVVGNDDEFGLLAGGNDKGRALAKRLGARPDTIAVYKMGERGSVTYVGEDTIELGVFRVTALKPTGAGDAFLAGFASSLAAGRPLADAVKRGSAAAAIVVTRVGCAPAMPNSNELTHFMAKHPGPVSGT
jgi:5-dehydro-2-deoxygluconokinase